jgi:hypothetical protein
MKVSCFAYSSTMMSEAMKTHRFEPRASHQLSGLRFVLISLGYPRNAREGHIVSFRIHFSSYLSTLWTSDGGGVVNCPMRRHKMLDGRGHKTIRDEETEG